MAAHPHQPDQKRRVVSSSAAPPGTPVVHHLLLKVGDEVPVLLRPKGESVERVVRARVAKIHGSALGGRGRPGGEFRSRSHWLATFYRLPHGDMSLNER